MRSISCACADLFATLSLLCLLSGCASVTPRPMAFDGATAGIATLSADAQANLTGTAANVSLYKPGACVTRSAQAPSRNLCHKGTGAACGGRHRSPCPTRLAVRYSFSETISSNAVSAQLSPPAQRFLANFQNLFGVTKSF
jgi:hypothetical protein